MLYLGNVANIAASVINKKIGTSRHLPSQRNNKQAVNACAIIVNSAEKIGSSTWWSFIKGTNQALIMWCSAALTFEKNIDCVQKKPKKHQKSRRRHFGLLEIMMDVFQYHLTSDGLND